MRVWPLLALVGFSVLICVAASNACDFSVSSPANNATVGVPVFMSIVATTNVTARTGNPWMNYYLDGHYNQSDGIPDSPSSSAKTVSFGNLSLGKHTLRAAEYKASGASGLVCQTDVNITVENEDRIISPTNGATVSGTISVQVNRPANFNGWVNLHVDNIYIASSNSSELSGDGTVWTIPWDTTLAGKDNSAPHNLDAQYKDANGNVVDDPTISVTIEPPGATPTPTPGATPTPVGAPPPSGSLPPNWISSLTGAATNMAISVDTDPTHFGQYNAPGMNSINGIPMIGGPLLTDVQAASVVDPTNPSSNDGTTNLGIDDYFQTIARNNPSDYQNQIAAFESGAGSSNLGGGIGRIDGACPLKNPTTGEVLQWAAAKWGLNPILAYASAANETGWNPSHAGDCDPDGSNCTSHGIMQVGDRNSASRPNHAFPGLTGSNLAIENTCFNADYWAGHLWAAYYGLTPETPKNNDNVDIALQSWFQGNASAPGAYSQQIDNIIARGWQSALQASFGVTFPNGEYLTGAAPQPVSPTP